MYDHPRVLRDDLHKPTHEGGLGLCVGLDVFVVAAWIAEFLHVQVVEFAKGRLPCDVGFPHSSSVKTYPSIGSRRSSGRLSASLSSK